jgi:Ser/Thr protein kinase RdoA (MazF antagonist)
VGCGIVIEQAHAFLTSGEPIYCGLYGNGHINETYLLLDSKARTYILQRVNRTVFQDPELLMQNIESVCAHIKQTAKSNREHMTLIPTKNGKNWHIDEDGYFWRLYEFIADSVCIEQAPTPYDFRESAVAFGRFARSLSGFDADSLHETIPRFHDTPNRFALLHDAISADPLDRVKTVAREIEFALSREAYAAKLVDLQKSGDLPARVTHNDTKLNNVLFDRTTRRALCVIDLDTVMPGLAVTDFGDAIRFGASTAVEDERDLSKVAFSMEMYSAYADGFLAECGGILTSVERECLRDGAKMMTLECGVRFLTDYISGDVYFRVSRASQNLDRARTQFKLITEIESNWENMRLG